MDNFLGLASRSEDSRLATLIPEQWEGVEPTSSLLAHPRRPPLSDRGFQLWMPGWTWLQGGGGNSVPPSFSISPPFLLPPPPARSLSPSLFLL